MFIFFLIYWFALFVTSRKKQHQNNKFYSRNSTLSQISYKNTKKPSWVVKEIIKLKALMPDAGCRTIAHTFNRRYLDKKGMSVSKTYVAYTIKKHHYDIKIVKRKLKHKKPRMLKLNKIWAMDLTFLRDSDDIQSTVLGIIEHQSRLSVSLTQLKTKSTINILKTLIIAIETFGKPENIRTDNEIVFTSRLFRFSLWLLGIKHQKSDKGCPWQNGRIERFFGTFKSKLKQLPVGKKYPMSKLLTEYRCWYNQLRPHDYLDGKTPNEVFTGNDKYLKKPKIIYFWDGVLIGDHYPSCY